MDIVENAAAMWLNCAKQLQVFELQQQGSDLYIFRKEHGTVSGCCALSTISLRGLLSSM